MADNKKFKYEGIDAQNINFSEDTKEKKTGSLGGLIRQGVSGLSSWWFSKERRLKNEYLKAEANLTKTMNTQRVINNKSDMLKMNKDVTEAYRKAFDATLRLAEYLKKSKDPKRQELTAQMGRQLTQMQANRGHLTSMLQNGIIDIGDPKKSAKVKDLFSKTPDEFFKESEITKFVDKEEYKSGAMNTVFKAKEKTSEDNEKEKDVIIKPGNMFLKHEDSFDDKLQVSKDIYLKASGQEVKDRTAYWSQHDKLGYDGKDDLFTVEKATVKPVFNEEGEEIEMTQVVEEQKKRTIETAFRDQGTFAVSQLLGFDVIVPTKLGVDENNTYVSVMDMAEGISAHRYNGYLTTQYKKELEQVIDKQVIDKKFSPKGAQKQKDKLLDLTDSSLQREMTKLAIVDIICGQEDRHTGNFFISGEPGRYKVTGIDNDFSFGMGKSPTTKEEAKQFQTDGKNYAISKGTAFGSNPTHIYTALPVVSQDIKDKVMNITQDDLRNALKGTVDMGDRGDERVEAAVKRLEAVQKHLNQCYLIPKGENYNKHTAQMLLPPVDSTVEPVPHQSNLGKMNDYKHPAIGAMKESSPMYTLFEGIVTKNQFKNEKHVSLDDFNKIEGQIESAGMDSLINQKANNVSMSKKGQPVKTGMQV
jgi:hypothetical protein